MGPQPLGHLLIQKFRIFLLLGRYLGDVFTYIVILFIVIVILVIIVVTSIDTFMHIGFFIVLSFLKMKSCRLLTRRQLHEGKPNFPLNFFHDSLFAFFLLIRYAILNKLILVQCLCLPVSFQHFLSWALICVYCLKLVRMSPT